VFFKAGFCQFSAIRGPAVEGEKRKEEKRQGSRTRAGYRTSVVATFLTRPGGPCARKVPSPFRAGTRLRCALRLAAFPDLVLYFCRRLFLLCSYALTSLGLGRTKSLSPRGEAAYRFGAGPGGRRRYLIGNPPQPRFQHVQVVVIRIVVKGSSKARRPPKIVE